MSLLATELPPQSDAQPSYGPVRPIADQLPPLAEPDWTRIKPFEGISGEATRVRLSGHLALHGSQYFIRVSEPDPDASIGLNEPTPLIAHFPGWTESVDCGTARHLHNELATLNPAARILSIATDGVSLHGNPVRHMDALYNPFVNMGRARQRIIRQFAGEDANVTLVGTSMGSVLAVHTAFHNIIAGHPVNLAELQLLTPGVIACEVPDNVDYVQPIETKLDRIKMLRTFLMHAAVDLGHEGLLHPDEARELARENASMLLQVMRHPSKLTAIGGNLVELMRGTLWGILETTAEEYPISVVTGTNDPLRSLDQWRSLQKLHPHHVSIRTVDGKGHLMTVDSKATARHLAS